MTSRSKLNIAILSLIASGAVSANSQLLPIEVEADAPSANSQSTEVLLESSGNTESGAILRQFSGVEAQRMGGHGLDVLIRGQGQSAVTVLIDGGKIEGGCPNRMDPPTSYSEISSFDSITVIKGVQSLQYGVGGTGGTVLLEREKPTFDAAKAYQGKVHAATNSNGLTQDIGTDVAAGGDQGYVRLQAAYKDAQSYKDGNGDTVRSSYQTTQGHIDLGWTPSEDHHLKLSHEIANTADALFQGAGMDAPKSDGSMTRLRYQGQNFTGPVNAVDLQVYRSEVAHVMDNFSLRPSGAMRSEVPSDVTTQGGKLKLTSQFSATQLDYGFMLQAVEKQATLFNRVNNQSQFLMWPNTSTEQNSLFVEANTALSASQNVIYGLRVDSVSAEAKEANKAPDNNMGNREPVNLYAAAYSGYSGNTKITETNWNGLVRYQQQLNNTLDWFGGLSLTTRTADETERFMARADWTGNPDLKPEKHLQLDLGLNHTSQNLNWSANAYFDRVSDYILRDLAKNQASANARPVGMAPNTNTSGINNIYVNIDAQIYGAEFDMDYRLNQAWLLSGQLAYTQGKNTTDNRRLSNIAPLNAQFSAQYVQSNWYAAARANLATQQTQVNSAYGEPETAAWQTLDVYGGYQINKTFMLQAGVDNLTDKAYFNHVNRTDPTTGHVFKVMEPGRNIWARVEAKF
ncbi:TonB-dependent receptor domain-containing protein [Thiomicrospira microaerophila]|uniref:TonB-dependent receptor domain-containing protein n=1 Tax=Thiomicrospira microaerophila TaxID=406020 RepID=UPI0005C929D3|nr:TonB-dependent receptor [Thiomicrospira microaerophila]